MAAPRRPSRSDANTSSCRVLGFVRPCRKASAAGEVKCERWSPRASLAAFGDEGARGAADQRARHLREQRTAQARAAERGKVEEDSAEAQRADPHAVDSAITNHAATAALAEGLHPEWLNVVERRRARAAHRVDREEAHARVTLRALPGRAIAREALGRVALTGARAGVGYWALEQAAVVDARRPEPSTELLHGPRRRTIGGARALPARVAGARVSPRIDDETGVSACVWDTRVDRTARVAALVDRLQALTGREAARHEKDGPAHAGGSPLVAGRSAVREKPGTAPGESTCDGRTDDRQLHRNSSGSTARTTPCGSPSHFAPRRFQSSTP